MKLLKQIFPKVIEFYNNTYQFAKSIRYYENNTEFFDYDKEHVLDNFHQKFDLTKYTIKIDKDIYVLNIPNKREYIFVSNNEELIFLIPNSTSKSCMSLKGTYFRMLLFEKILFNNAYFVIFTMNKKDINLKNDLNQIKEDKMQLLAKFHYSDSNNKRVNVIYLPNNVAVFLELYYKNKINNKEFANFINAFTDNNKSGIFVDSIDLSYTPDIIQIIDKNKFDEIRGYNHKVKTGYLISNESNVINIARNSANYNSQNFVDEILNFKNIFANKFEKIKLIINYIYQNATNCFLCGDRISNKNGILCNSCENYYEGVDIVRELTYTPIAITFNDDEEL